MSENSVREYVEKLRDIGNDTYRIEAKDASGGLPQSISETLSAFGNMPEGGVILLGVAEDGGTFPVTGIADPKTMESQLANKARQKIVPPLQLGAIETATIEGKTVLQCVVPPQPSDRKPFRVGRGARPTSVAATAITSLTQTKNSSSSRSGACPSTTAPPSKAQA